ncbi:short chain dehydrogenase/reductase [Nemania sp. FL0916]|nr:short chain dehydrogenase/reductase [Nemania sp. FL0916]
MNSLTTFTSALGAGIILYASYQILDTAWLYTRPSSLCRRYLYTDSSGRRAWALVTGSTNGIGKCLAQELAANGFNIVLHGRSARKLQTTCAELRAAYPEIEIRILIADAAQCHLPESVDFKRIRDDLADINLTVLVNCAGAGPKPAFGTLEAYTQQEILDNLRLNVTFPTLLTAALIPVLRGEGTQQQHRKAGECIQIQNGGAHIHTLGPGQQTRAVVTTAKEERSREKRRALIINIGSVTDDGFPLVSFYSAGKAATHALHKALAREAELLASSSPSSSSSSTFSSESGVELEIISHRVGAVTGVSHTQAPATLFRPHARTIAKAVLARTGCGRKAVFPYFPHLLQNLMLGALPARVVDQVINAAMREERCVEEGKMRVKTKDA